MNRKMIPVEREEIFKSWNDEEGKRALDAPIKFNINDIVDTNKAKIGEHILYECPTHCGKICGVPLKTSAFPVDKGWNFDGKKQCPTLTPSIQCLAEDCRWHGFITNGELITLP